MTLDTSAFLVTCELVIIPHGLYGVEGSDKVSRRLFFPGSVPRARKQPRFQKRHQNGTRNPSLPVFCRFLQGHGPWIEEAPSSRDEVLLYVWGSSPYNPHTQQASEHEVIATLLLREIIDRLSNILACLWSCQVITGTSPVVKWHHSTGWRVWTAGTWAKMTNQVPYRDSLVGEAVVGSTLLGPRSYPAV